MFFLVTGASGMGKSTVRSLVAPRFADRVEAAELVEIAGPPEWSLRWRHQAVEKVVRRALEAAARGKHFLLCGDPVPPAEVLAAPSSDKLAGGLRVCLLDAAEHAQRARLTARGDDPALLPAHTAFAAWFREHIGNPGHRLDVITANSWEEMRWDRVPPPGPDSAPWPSFRIDTTDLIPEEAAERVAAWIDRDLAAGGVACGRSVWREGGGSRTWRG